jgi:hypothetical protein
VAEPQKSSVHSIEASQNSISVVAALLAGGEVHFLETLDPGTAWQARKALLRGAVPAPLVDLA